MVSRSIRCGKEAGQRIEVIGNKEVAKISIIDVLFNWERI